MSLLTPSDAEALETIARSVSLVRPDLGKVLRSVLRRLEETRPCAKCNLTDVGAAFVDDVCPRCVALQTARMELAR